MFLMISTESWKPWLIAAWQAFDMWTIRMIEYLYIPGTEPTLLYGATYLVLRTILWGGTIPISILLEIKTLRFKHIK